MLSDVFYTYNSDVTDVQSLLNLRKKLISVKWYTGGYHVIKRTHIKWGLKGYKIVYKFDFSVYKNLDSKYFYGAYFSVIVNLET